MHKEFNVGDHAYLWVKVRKNLLKFGRCTKLALRLCGPCEVLDRIGLVEYHRALWGNLKVHKCFHISLLKKYVHEPTHVIGWNLLQVESEGEF